MEKRHKVQGIGRKAKDVRQCCSDGGLRIEAGGRGFCLKPKVKRSSNLLPKAKFPEPYTLSRAPYTLRPDMCSTLGILDHFSSF